MPSARLSRPGLPFAPGLGHKPRMGEPLPSGASDQPRGPQTRCATLPKSVARVVLALFIVALFLGLPGSVGPGPQTASWPGDTALYRAVIVRLRKGESYEPAAVAEMRARHFQMRPFLVVRPPALEVMLSWAPNDRAPAIAQALLALCVLVAWMFRLRDALPGPWGLAWTGLAVSTGVIAGMIGGEAPLFHEEWAGLLIALSLALRTDRRFAVAVGLGLLAALIRELAIPYLLVMAAFAGMEKRWRESAAFGAALAVSILALAVHAGAVNSLLTSQDQASRHWMGFAGWPLITAANSWNLIAVLFGPWLRAFIFPLALIGALGWKDRRLIVLLAGFAAGFMVIGRLENYYWGLIITPLVGVGLALTPPALRDLWRAARPPALSTPATRAHM